MNYQVYTYYVTNRRQYKRQSDEEGSGGTHVEVGGIPQTS
jgi:hypothetical protein